jgi:DNA-binding GntR family transcriptional regulator
VPTLAKAARPPADADPSAVERIASALRDEVRLGRLVPDQRLVEADLVERFHVSRGTVREATRKLVAEGLLTREHNRSVRVRRMSAEEVASLYRVRESLEGLAARMAAENIERPGHRVQLERLRREMAATAARGDIDTYYRHNETMHSLIVAQSGNTHLVRLVDQLRLSTFRVQFWGGALIERCRRSHRDHEVIFTAILAGQPSQAATAMCRHIRNSAAEVRLTASDAAQARAPAPARTSAR